MNNQGLNCEGRKLVEAELLRRGAASVTSSGTRRIILHATNSTHSRTIDILVKTKQQNNWQTRIDEAIKTTTPPDLAKVNKFWVFVDFSAGQRYWIVPDWWIRNDIYEAHKRFLSRHAGRRPVNTNSTHHSIAESRLIYWQGNWGILGIF